MAKMTGIEYTEVGEENLIRPVFDKTPITCLSIFDSILFQSFLDGSTIAFDLSTRQSFPLTGTRPMAFFPPLMQIDSSSEDEDDPDTPAHAMGHDSPRQDSPAAEVTMDSEVPQRHITSVVIEDAISPHAIPVRKLESLCAEEFVRIRPDAFEPLLLTGATKGWGAHDRWTFPFFCEGQLGQTNVLVTGRDGKRSQMKLCDYVGLFREAGGKTGDSRDWLPTLVLKSSRTFGVESESVLACSTGGIQRR